MESEAKTPGTVSDRDYPMRVTALSAPPPPRLHWGWVLALSLVTYGLFLPIWLLVQARWVRHVRGRSLAFGFAIANLCFLPVAFVAVLILAFMADSPDIGETPQRAGSLIAFAILLALYFTTIFSLRAELRAAPIAIALNGPLSFLGGPVYVQARIRESGQPSTPAGRFGLT